MSKLKIIAGRYELKEQLGSGGVSTVYRGWDIVKNAEVAVKVIHPHLAENEVVVQRFKQELAITRKIHHNGIVEYYDILELEGNVFLTLEYLAGGDLKTRIRDGGPLPVSECTRIGIEILEAMQAAHEQGVIHCDIKPHNVLFDGDGHIRIADFGFARSTAAFDLTGQRTAGTPDYAAPEVTMNTFPDARSDLYSFGVTLFEMLTCRLPFQSNNPHETLWKHANMTPPSVRAFEPGTPEIFDQIIQKSMEKNLSDRYQTAKEFCDALMSLSLPSPPASAATHLCAYCGQPIIDALPYCFSCDKTETILIAAAQRRVSCRVIVTGPGKPGDRMDPELRHRILSLVVSVGAESSTIEKKIPRLPFVLLSDLSIESAEKVKSELAHLGVFAEISGKPSKQLKNTVFGLFNRKLLVLYPRYLLIGLGSAAGGLWQMIGRAPPWLLLGIFSILVLVVPTILRLSFKKPLAIRKDLLGTHTLATLLKPVQQLNTDQLKQLLRRIAEKFDVLYSMSHGLTATVLDDALQEIASLFETVGELEAELLKIDAMGVGKNFVTGVSKAVDVSPIANPHGPQQLTSGYEDALTVRRNIENTLQQYIDKILAFSVGIDQLSIALAGISEGKARILQTELAKLSTALTIETESMREWVE
ncbi:MAG: hypothetical protein CMN78_03880 [Spirochaetales bacterium]|nr:hypothetical protein [Spirochaetales bacterium]